MDSEFLKEYEDAITDRDKKIAELMSNINELKEERNTKNKNEPIKISFLNDRIDYGFEILNQLEKKIENEEHSPKFKAEDSNNSSAYKVKLSSNFIKSLAINHTIEFLVKLNGKVFMDTTKPLSENYI